MAPTSPATVYLIPTLLSEEGLPSIPPEVCQALEACRIFFVEQERTARRQIRKLIPGFTIDDRRWHVLAEAEMPEVRKAFLEALQGTDSIGILSEAGCPGIADPGQELVRLAQTRGATVRPLTGPSAILLALMASGLNGQLFRFNGYLPVPAGDRIQALRILEQDAWKTGSTQIFIETPYRNDALLDSLLAACRADTLLCVAIALTSAAERIQTQSVQDWKRQKPRLGKVPCIFLLGRP
ncbi:MAG: SAM-dependent methyltransferase [Bacteroidetes bacterium]|nr:SAM-dependent methyltransferase [Bacteroidota bacterium]